MTTPNKEEPGSKADKYEPPGVNFKAKMIGIKDVPEARGDKMCLESMGKLKAIVKEKGEHKQKIVVNVSLEGIKIIDERTLGLNHTHEVHKISFISRDPTDRRAFGYVYGDEGHHKFYAIKTGQQADLLVISLKELFEAVLEVKQQQMSVQKQKIEETTVYLESSYDQPIGQATQKKQENGGVVQEQITANTSEPAYAVPDKMKDPEGVKQRALSNLVDLEKEMKTIQEGISTMSDFDLAFDSLPSKSPADNPFTAGDPFAPAASAAPAPAAQAQAPAANTSQGGGSVDLFSVQSPPAQSEMTTRKSSDDLFAEFSDTFTSPTPASRPAPSLTMPTQPPPPNPFAAGFGAGGGAGGMGGGFGGGFGQPAPGAGGFGQPAPGAFGDGFQQPAPAAFQSTWGPPAPTQPAMGGGGGFGQPKPASDPFAVGGGDFDAFTLQPQSTAPPPGQAQGTKKADPFGDIGVLGSKKPDTSGKKAKDPFAGFKMAKPGEVTVPDLKTQAQASGNLKDNLTLDIAADNNGTHDSADEFSLPSPEEPPPPLPTNIDIHIESIEESANELPPPPPPRPRSYIPKDGISPPPITPRSHAVPLPIPPRHRPPSSTSTLSFESQSETDSSRGAPSIASTSSLSSPSPSMTRNPHSCPSKLATCSPLSETQDEVAVNGNNHSPTSIDANRNNSSDNNLRQSTLPNGTSPETNPNVAASSLHGNIHANHQTLSSSVSADSQPTRSFGEKLSTMSTPHGRAITPDCVNAPNQELADASLLSSSLPTNNSFHALNVHIAHLSSSVSNPSLCKAAKVHVPVLPKHEDPFADNPFDRENDPFAEDPFKSGRKDPFKSESDQDPFESRTEDPFKSETEDPFKSTTGDPFNSENEDPFKSAEDPFKSESGDPFKSNTQDPFISNSEDPFTSEKGDPFKNSEDPFNNTEDPFTNAEDPFKSGAQDPFKSDAVATSSDNWANFSSDNNSNNRTANDGWADFSCDNRTENDSFFKQNGGLTTNVSNSDAWTDPFGAPPAGGEKKGLTTSDGQPLFDSSPFGF